MGAWSFAYSRGSGGGSDPTLAARVTVLEDNLYEFQYWTSINSISGSITPPTNSTIRLDQIEGGVDSYVNTIIGGQPSGIVPITAGGAYITSTLDSLGNYTLSGTPTSFPIAIVYVISIKGLYLSNLDLNNVVNFISKLYNGLGSNTDGSVTQDVITDNIDNLQAQITANEISTITGTGVLNFGTEEDEATLTIANVNITNTNINSFTWIPLETSETSIDDFKLNSVIFVVESITDNVSFTIKGMSDNNASGNYSIKYTITHGN